MPPERCGEIHGPSMWMPSACAPTGERSSTAAMALSAAHNSSRGAVMVVGKKEVVPCLGSPRMTSAKPGPPTY